MAKNLVRAPFFGGACRMEGVFQFLSASTFMLQIALTTVYAFACALHTDPVTGQTPTYHIPARFVTLIPRSFPAAQANTAPKTNAKRKSAPGSLPSIDGGGGGPPGFGPGSEGNKRGRQMSLSSIMPTSSDDALNDMLSEMEDFPTTSGPLDNFDQLDLDFDQPATSR
jgi:hypothetical protein